MQINGDGIATPIIAKVKPDFAVLTTPALKWVQLTSGNFEAVDRGAGEDLYSAKVRLYGFKTTIDEFLEAFEDNRGASSGTPNELSLSSFNETEKIFGADVDYSEPIPCTITKLREVKQRTWRGFSLEVRINALSTAFVGSPAMPALNLLKVGYTGDGDYTINKILNYDGSFTHIDHKADTGLFKGVFTFSEAEAIQFRRYVATERGNTVQLNTISGVAEPFGTRRGGSYPYDVKIIDWKERGMRGLHQWLFEITFAEVH